MNKDVQALVGIWGEAFQRELLTVNKAKTLQPC